MSSYGTSVLIKSHTPLERTNGQRYVCFRGHIWIMRILRIYRIKCNSSNVAASERQRRRYHFERSLTKCAVVQPSGPVAQSVSFSEIENSMYKRRRLALHTLPHVPEAGGSAIEHTRYATVHHFSAVKYLVAPMTPLCCFPLTPSCSSSKMRT